jgi:c(7)-type cytochrome triheme protein
MKIKTQILQLTLGCLLFLTILPVMGAAPGDLLYKRTELEESTANTFPPSTFQHWSHRILYRCDACHDSLFEMNFGTNPVTMDMMKEGEVCGACHDGKTAFDTGFGNCSRCHKAPTD